MTPQQTIQQVVNPPQTNIKSSTYSIAGVDPAQPGIGLVTPSLLSSGRFLTGGNEALVADSYASTHSLKVGSTLDLNGTKFTIVGLVKPPLGGQTADVYIPLAKLQTLASQKSLTNVVLVRASGSSSVGKVQKEIQAQFPNAQVASAKQVADQISGSLVDASNLSHRLGIALAALAAFAAFLLAALLDAVVGRQARPRARNAEGARLDAAPRRPPDRRRVVRAGRHGRRARRRPRRRRRRRDRRVRADTHRDLVDQRRPGRIRARRAWRGTVTDQVALTAPIAVTILLIGFGVALAGGLLAGAAGAFRAARLRPADALRTVE